MNIQSNESTVSNTGKIAHFKLAVEDIAMLQECDHGSHLGMKEELFLARKLKTSQNFWFDLIFFPKILRKKTLWIAENPQTPHACPSENPYFQQNLLLWIWQYLWLISVINFTVIEITWKQMQGSNNIASPGMVSMAASLVCGWEEQ